MLLAGWLLISWLPSKRPLTEAEIAMRIAKAARDLDAGQVRALRESRLKPEYYKAGYAIAILIFVLGLSSTIRGATWKTHKELTCTKCSTRVVGKKEAFGVRCPLANHYAEVNGAAVLLLVLIFVVAVVLIAGGMSS